MTPRPRPAAAGALALAALAMVIVAAQELPRLTQPVNDLAAMIDAASAHELDRRIRALETATRDAIVIVTVETIAPYDSIEDYATRLFERAGIGQRGRDTGLLIVVAKRERRVRIEVGYDLEAFVTDGFAGEVIRQDFLPAFRDGRVGAGLLAGTTRLIHRIAEGRGIAVADVPPGRRAYDEGVPVRGLGLLPFALLLLFIIVAIARAKQGPTSGYRGPWNPWGGFGGPFGGLGGFGGTWGGRGGFSGRGGGFGGFGGFGGGRSGGGGASGRW